MARKPQRVYICRLADFADFSEGYGKEINLAKIRLILPIKKTFLFLLNPRRMSASLQCLQDSINTGLILQTLQTLGDL